MYRDNDRMEVGDLVPIDDGWFEDLNTGQQFYMDDCGQLRDEWGFVLYDPEVDDE